MEVELAALACSVCGIRSDSFTINSLWILERNMYLAEDRILCFEIVTKKREAWVYVQYNHVIYLIRC